MDGNQGSNLTSCTFYKDLSDGFIKGGCGASKICVRDGSWVALECLGEKGCMVWSSSNSDVAEKHFRFEWAALGDCHERARTIGRWEPVLVRRSLISLETC